MKLFSFRNIFLSVALGEWVRYKELLLEEISIIFLFCV